MYSQRRISRNLFSVFLVKSQVGSTKIRTFNNLFPNQHFIFETIRGSKETEVAFDSRPILKLQILVLESVDVSWIWW